MVSFDICSGPPIDCPQHLRGSLPGIFYSFKGKNSFDWLTDPAWTKKQQYLPDTNIVRTIFKHQNPDLNITTGWSGVGAIDVVYARVGYLFDGPGWTEAFVINRCCRSDCGHGDLGCCLPVPAVVGFYRLCCHWGLGDIGCLFRFWTCAGLLADDFRDLSLKGPRCCHECGDSCQLGI